MELNSEYLTTVGGTGSFLPCSLHWLDQSMYEKSECECMCLCECACHICAHVHMCECIQMKFVCKYVVHAYVHASTHVCAYLCVYACVCLSVEERKCRRSEV